MQITAFAADYVQVNQQRYTQSLIVCAEQVVSPWYAGDWASLSAESLQVILSLAPELVLLGTGDQHRFIHPKHLIEFSQAHIAVECMSTAAACRTFNILTAEGRKPVAALLLESGWMPRTV